MVDDFPFAAREHPGQRRKCLIRARREKLHPFPAELFKLNRLARPLQRLFLKADPTKLEPWRDIMDRNSPGQAPAGVPVFLSQGTADDIVRPDITGCVS